MAGAKEASLADLTTQLAHLKWRKCVNDAKIQNKIASSRALAERDLLVQLSENRAAARAKWRSSVIASELTRPLEIDEHFLRELEDEEQVQRVRRYYISRGCSPCAALTHSVAASRSQNSPQ